MDRGILNRNIQRTLPSARILETGLPLCPEIRLSLISADNMKRQFSPDEIRRIQQKTPYWSFCWASGQAMAWFILKNRPLFEGKSILDFGSGSGIVAIAAAMAGAKEVAACDSDRDAIDATEVNAALNGVRVNTCESLEEVPMECHMILTADVLYDRENYGLLERFLEYAPEVFVADSRLKTIDVTPYRRITQITTTTIPDLHEGDEFNHVNIYRAGNSSAILDGITGLT
ncbi:MAG: 50S ribosomal protein L11 methyltransferase [Pseudomonadota bacterium]